MHTTICGLHTFCHFAIFEQDGGRPRSAPAGRRQRHAAGHQHAPTGALTKHRARAQSYLDLSVAGAPLHVRTLCGAPLSDGEGPTRGATPGESGCSTSIPSTESRLSVALVPSATDSLADAKDALIKALKIFFTPKLTVRGVDI